MSRRRHTLALGLGLAALLLVQLAVLTHRHADAAGHEAVCQVCTHASHAKSLVHAAGPASSGVARAVHTAIGAPAAHRAATLRGLAARGPPRTPAI